MSRKNGAPYSLSQWQTDIMSRASTPDNPAWLRIKGLTAIAYEVASETTDGAGEGDPWQEPYVKQRSSKLTLEGKPIKNALTGEEDPGQAELSAYARLSGFEGDARIRLSDPVGRCVLVDAVVTEVNQNADPSGEKISWTLEGVGEPVYPPYIQVENIHLPAAEMTIRIGETALVTAEIAPANASNQKISAASADPRIARVKGLDGLTFAIEGAKEGGTEIVLRTMNNGHEARLGITVSGGAA